MDAREETGRLFAIAEILEADVSCGEGATIDEWQDDLAKGVVRMMRTLGITRADGTCDDEYAKDICETFSDEPTRLYAGLFFQSGACDGGSNYHCVNGCRLTELCPSCYDPRNLAEECGADLG